MGVDGVVVPAAEAVLWRGPAFVRVHVAVDAASGRPLRGSTGDRARVTPAAAGAGPVVVTDRRVLAVIRATAGRPSVAARLDWAEVDDVGPSAHGGVRLLASALLGGLTVQPLKVD